MRKIIFYYACKLLRDCVLEFTIEGTIVSKNGKIKRESKHFVESLIKIKNDGDPII